MLENMSYADSVGLDHALHLKATLSAILLNRITLTHQQTVYLTDKTVQMCRLIWSYIVWIYHVTTVACGR